jgi:spermidine/putrescine-binding protein
MKTLAYVTHKGLPVMINTNAICFAPEIENALKSGNALVQVSLDCGDREGYFAIKGVDKFDSVAENIDRYAAAVRDGSTFWLKYIVFSKTNPRERMDKFIDFCIQHRIKNVSVNADYNEGQDIITNWEIVNKHCDSASIDSLKAFGYLATRLEMAGVCVHKELDHLTINEQRLTKREYALAVLDALKYAPDDMEPSIENIVEGFELVTLPTDSHRLKNHFAKLLQGAVKDSRIALFGVGVHAQWVNCVMNEFGINPIAAFDNNPPARPKFTFPVVKPAEISKYDVDTVIIASNAYHLNIYSQLVKMPEFLGVRIIDPYLNLPG